MNTRSVQIAIWIIAVCAVIFLVKNIFLPENRFQVVPNAATEIVARIDTKTVEIEGFLYDPRDQKFKSVEGLSKEFFKGIPKKKERPEGYNEKK